MFGNSIDKRQYQQYRRNGKLGDLEQKAGSVRVGKRILCLGEYVMGIVGKRNIDRIFYVVLCLARGSWLD